jgi:hypothetical protein
MACRKRTKIENSIFRFIKTNCAEVLLLDNIDAVTFGSTLSTITHVFDHCPHIRVCATCTSAEGLHQSLVQPYRLGRPLKLRLSDLLERERLLQSLLCGPHVRIDWGPSISMAPTGAPTGAPTVAPTAAPTTADATGTIGAGARLASELASRSQGMTSADLCQLVRQEFQTSWAAQLAAPAPASAPIAKIKEEEKVTGGKVEVVVVVEEAADENMVQETSTSTSCSSAASAGEGGATATATAVTVVSASRLLLQVGHAAPAALQSLRGGAEVLRFLRHIPPDAPDPQLAGVQAEQRRLWAAATSYFPGMQMPLYLLPQQPNELEAAVSGSQSKSPVNHMRRKCSGMLLLFVAAAGNTSFLFSRG